MAGLAPWWRRAGAGEGDGEHVCDWGFRCGWGCGRGWGCGCGKRRARFVSRRVGGSRARCRGGPPGEGCEAGWAYVGLGLGILGYTQYEHRHGHGVG